VERTGPKNENEDRTMSDMKRRDFLRLAGTGAAASLAGRELFAQQGKKKEEKKPDDLSPHTLVTVYLRGGQDALNTLVPYGEKRYYDLRPTIAIKPPDDAEHGALKLDGMFAFHPSLKSLKPFFDEGKLAPIVNVGSPHGTRSHFDAQDFMEYAAPGMRTVTSGWLNRYLQATQDRAAKIEKEKGFSLRALAMQNLLPRALRGPSPALAVPDGHILNNDRVLGTFENIYGDDKAKKDMPAPGMDARKEDDVVVSVGQDTLETLKRYKDAIRKPRTGGGARGNYSGWFASKLRDISSIIHADVGLEVACLDYGGWDHHTAEGNIDGAIARMLKEVSDALAAFATDLGDHLSHTMVLVMTEFGRNCDENGNRGTDHGRGGMMLALGGPVKGGKVRGDWRGLQPKDLADGRDLPIATDFRDVFSAVLTHHMKAELPKGFFPDFTPKPVQGLF
jgi:uncharacterized protein (DUF1501 family)